MTTRKKDKKSTVSELDVRLSSDENAWVKLLGSMGDFARYWRQLEAQLKKDRRLIEELRQRITILEGKAHTHVAN